MLTVPLNVWCFYICHAVAFSSVIFKLGGNFKQLLGLRDAPEFRGSLSEIIRIFWLFPWRNRFWNSGSSDRFWNKYLMWTWDYPEFCLTFRQSEFVQYPFCNLENFRFPFNLKLTRNSSWLTFFSRSLHFQNGIFPEFNCNPSWDVYLFKFSDQANLGIPFEENCILRKLCESSVFLRGEPIYNLNWF